MLNQPIVGMAARPQGDGYWMVAADGGIFSFGRAALFGSAAVAPLPAPATGMVPTPDGRGYIVVDGTTYRYGSAVA